MEHDKRKARAGGRKKSGGFKRDVKTRMRGEGGGRERDRYLAQSDDNGSESAYLRRA